MTKNDEPLLLRVLMKETQTIERTKGSYSVYQAGELFLLPKKQADEWIKEGVAIDPTQKSEKEAK